MKKYTVYQAAFVRQFVSVVVEAENEDDALAEYQSMDGGELEWTTDSDYWDEAEPEITELTEDGS